MAILQIYTILAIFLILLLPMMTSSVTDSEALLNFKKSLTNTYDLDPSWVPNSSPCNEENRWVGIHCNNGNVTAIRLEEMNLSGKINIASLQPLSNVRAISIVGNHFSGPIPEFHLLGSLKAIFLSGNHFSGEIPSDYFSKMQSLKKVWLSHNSFTGKIPSSLGDLPQLRELYLQSNEFSGIIPSIEQTTLVSLNFSNNKLEGEIPKSLVVRFNKTSFSGNEYLCCKDLDMECKSLDKDEQKRKGINNMIGVAIMASGAILLALVVVAIVLIKVRENKEKQFDVLGKKDLDEVHRSVSSIKDQGSRKGPGSSRNGSSWRSGTVANSSGRMADLIIVNDQKGPFGLSDLMKAAAEVLGNGGLGSTYKALMSNGVAVVVKRMRDLNRVGKDGFGAEMRRLGRLRHPNILPPLAFHYRRDEKLLVYQYIPKGSLLYLLHGDRGPSHADLNWPIRLKIVKGIVRGLEYLQKEFLTSELYHGNLKSSNIFLSSKYEPLLSEFGFNQLVNPQQVAQALFACKAPEAAQYGHVSPKCDVYCLGIIILEILTGKFPSHYLNNGKGGIDVVKWVNSAIAGGRELELIDPGLASASPYALPEMERLLHIGASCTDRNPELRLGLEEAIRRIKAIESEARGGQEGGRTFQVLPSLRDGYVDSSASQSSIHGYHDEYGKLSGKISDSHDEQSTHRNGGSFAFSSP